MSSETTSTTSEMATASSFSYAQAAKGQGGVPSNATSSQASQAAPSQTEPSTPQDAPTSESVRESSETTRSSEGRSTADTKETESTAGSESVTKPSGEKTTSSKRDESVSRLDRPWRRNDKGTRSSSTARDEPDNRRRKGKKGKQSDKQSTDQSADKSEEKEPEPVKVEYSEAPPPAVNPWLKRKEDLSTKAPTPSLDSHEQGNNDSSQQPAEQKVVKAAEPMPASTLNGGKAQRKIADSQRPERNSSRGNREAKPTVPPPVNDSMAWPTPETAITEEKKKTSADKPEATSKDKESDDGQPKLKHKKEWVTYEYVPSVNFETQLPQMRNSKSRSSPRGTNGPRSANGTQAGEKLSGPPTSKANEAKERPRENVNGANESTATPAPASKRTSVDVNALKEQRKSAPPPNTEKPKDAPAAQPIELSQAPRERPEGRSERGRGGYRGRGGHTSVNSHTHGASMNSTSFVPNGSLSRSHGHYSPPPRTGGHGQMYTPQRGGRGARNSNNNSFHRLSMTSGRLPQVQTQFAGYEYPVAPMTAVPFQPQPYWDSMIAATLKHQVEYYFSVENLCKDVFLRKRMDSQGFVPLHFIAGFRRVRDLSTDINLLRAVCEDSADIDFVIGEDDGERLRRRHGWENWVMPVEDRDELARSSGPRNLSFRNRTYGFGQAAMNGMQSMQFSMASPPAFPPQGEPHFQQFAEQGPHSIITNGHTMNHVDGLNGGTQLSAEVPDFSPSTAGFGKGVRDITAPALNGINGTAVNGVNGVHGEEAT